MADDFRPETAGIFPSLAGTSADAVNADGAPVPLPPPRPRPGQRQTPPVLAYSAGAE